MARSQAKRRAALVQPLRAVAVITGAASQGVACSLWRAAKGAYNGLLLGLGAVALLVGGVGIANVMVISVLERRSEIGLRRALGATRRHVAEQFLAEALLLSVLGGLPGTIIGAASTVIYAVSQHWSVQIPAVALYGGLGAALVIGAIAGLYPSMRAARLSPTEALRTV